MRKIMLAAFIGCATFLLQGNSLPATRAASATAWLTYYWYEDENYTVYTGYNSSVDTELTRLRALYPSYAFSGSPAIGLHEYEYGYHAVYLPTVIYSNK